MKAHEQIDLLRKRFGTSKIYNYSKSKSFTENEIEAIVVIIKQNKKDGQYEVNDELILELEKGSAYIKNNLNNE